MSSRTSRSAAGADGDSTLAAATLESLAEMMRTQMAASQGVATEQQSAIAALTQRQEAFENSIAQTVASMQAASSPSANRQSFAPQHVRSAIVTAQAATQVQDAWRRRHAAAQPQQPPAAAPAPAAAARPPPPPPPPPSGAQALAPFAEEDAALEDEDAHALLDRLDRLDAIDGTGQAADASAQLGDAFTGHDTPLPHAELNPYERRRAFARRTNHYHPSRVGDPLSGGLVESLERQAAMPGREVCSAYAYEVRSLIPALSCIFDLREALREQSLDLAAHQSTGAPLSARAAALAVDATVQCDAIYEHLGERLAIVRQVEQGSSTGIELLAQLYNREQAVTGARSKLEGRVEDMKTSRKASRLVTTEATEMARSSTVANRIMAMRPAPAGQSSFRAPRQQRGAGAARARGGAPAAQPAAGGARPAGQARQQQPPPQQQPRQQPAPPPPAALIGDGGPGRGGGKGGGRGGAPGGRGAGRG